MVEEAVPLGSASGEVFGGRGALTLSSSETVSRSAGELSGGLCADLVAVLVVMADCEAAAPLAPAPNAVLEDIEDKRS